MECSCRGAVIHDTKARQRLMGSMCAQRNDEAELRQMMAKKWKGLSEAKQARQALEAELAAVRGQMAARVAQLEAERDASAALAQACLPVHAQPDLPLLTSALNGCRAA